MFNELVKNFDTVRKYLREFYIYGFKERGRYEGKSGRLYDDMRRRIESWLGEFTSYRRTTDGKNVYVTIDSRAEAHNPLFRALKTKSFTDGDITLHFIIFDILQGGEYTLAALSQKIDDEYLSAFGGAPFDSSTLRKKLAEYEREGLISVRRDGNKSLYSATVGPDIDGDLLDFFSEALPCGVIGSYISDKQRGEGGMFSFKHHYITQALDSEVMCGLLAAIAGGYRVELDKTSRSGKSGTLRFLPLQIFVSAGGGRQYVAGFGSRSKRPVMLRLDRINKVRAIDKAEEQDIAACRAVLEDCKRHIWGASLGDDKLSRVRFTVSFGADEEHVYKRLEREKRCGTVRRLDEHTAEFSAEVYDAYEILPWIRTFIGRIVDYEISDEDAAKLFEADLNKAYELYGVGVQDGTV